MDYLKIYNELISSRRLIKRSKKEGYFESHHIIPKCVGGSDKRSNRVLLTAREHYICHFLLTKIYNISELIFAFNMMNVSSRNQQRYFNSKLYGANKERLRNILSVFASERIGDKNSMYGKNHSDDTKQKIKEWHQNMTEEEKKDRSELVSITTKNAMMNLSELKKYNMKINQNLAEYGYHFIMIIDDNEMQLFKNRNIELKKFLRENGYSVNFHNHEYSLKYTPKTSYSRNSSKESITRDKNTEGLIQFKMERIKL